MADVNDLLSKPFWNRPHAEKLRIVKRGKPRPKLKNLRSIKSEKDSSVNGEQQADKNSEQVLSHFDIELYDRVEWLTGCPVREALFCWPCLLFKVRSCVWNSTGIRDLYEIRSKMVDHGKSVPHIQAVLDLHLLAEEIVVEKPVKLVDNELIKTNREIVKRLINAICFLCSTQKKSRMESHKNTLPVEDCLENVQFLRNFDLLHLNIIDEALTMVQMRHQIINDLVDAINSIMKMEILKETQQSTFVSMIITEHSPNHTRSQISTVLRYLKRGEVCERFVGFTNKNSKLTPDLIAQHISKIITDFQISRRIVSYSLDGTVLLDALSFKDIKSKLQFCHPYIYFVPCYYHKLDTVLQESLSVFPACDIFFKHLKSLKSCLKEESKLWQVYRDFQAVNSTPSFLCFNTFNLKNTADFLNVVKMKRSSLITFFEFAVGKSEKLTPSDFVQVTALKAYLSDAKTIHLLEVFIKLFDVFAPVIETFNGPVPNLPVDSYLIDTVCNSFHEYREQEILWSKIMIDSLQEMKKTMDAITAVKTADEISVGLRKLFLDIGRCMSLQFRYRLESIKSMFFFNILDLEKSAKFLDSDDVRSMYAYYGQSILFVPLQNEIKLVVANKSVINIRSVHQLTKFFVVSNFTKTVPNLYRICELVLTLPCTVPTADQSGSSSKLLEIEPWTYKSTKSEVSGDLSLMCIERDVLEEVRQRKTFFDEVIAKFKEKNKSLKLSYETKKKI